MKGLKFVMLLFVAALFASTAEAQTGTLTGRVVDARTGAPLAGALVRLEPVGRSSLTNVDGRFRVADVPSGSVNVRVSYIGYTTQAQAVNVGAGDNNVDFALEVDPIRLDAIVVTGEQIERQARALAYAVSTVQAEELTRARPTNFVSALAGKAPGVSVVQQSGNLGGSTRIVIRGVSSLSGDNQPLFVIDGVPISNANQVAGTSQDRLTGAIDVGNRAADINPDDIESVTILKGAAAAALYGQRAKDGVILITTRRGAAIGGQTVTANSSLRWSDPLVLPDFHNEYAQGTSGAFRNTDLNGWGPRIAGQQATNIRGEAFTLQAQPNNVADFFDRGRLAINSVAFSSANEVADFRLGLSHQNEDGIIPGSNLTRSTVSLNSGYTLTSRLRARLSGSYTTTGSSGRAVQGGNDPNVLTSIVYSFPRTLDTGSLRDYKDELGRQRALTTTINNPYWVVFENPFTQGVERVFGNTNLAFNATPWLTLTGRAGLDYYTEDRRNINALGTIGRADGRLALDVITRRETTYGLLAEASRQINEDLNIRGIVGTSANEIVREIQRNAAQNLTVPGLYNFANAATNNPANNFLQRRLYGAFGDVTLGFREYLFLNVTGRNDWSSTLPRNNRSFFYPSANVSFVFTDALDLDPSVLTYGKLRVNVARVGSDEDPYQLEFTYSPQSTIFGQYGTGYNLPFQGRTAFSSTSIIPPTNLKPQNKTSFEFGGELQFLNGRAGFDLTYYDERTTDQIISIPIPESTGFVRNRTNIGEVSNKGIELALNLNPVRTRMFNWDSNINFDRNRNEVVSLAPGVNRLIMESGFSGVQVAAEPGRPFGIIGNGFLRDTTTTSATGVVTVGTNLPIIDPATGLRQTGPVQRFGSIDPDFNMSFINQFSFGRANLSFQVDWREGGIMFSNTVASLRRQGLAVETTVNRDGTFIDEGVLRNTDGTFRPNDVPVANMQSFWGRYADTNIAEGNIFDASNARLREVRLEYSLPRNWLANTPIGTMSVGLEGRNLWLFYKKIPHIDPEVGLFGSASNGAGIEWDVLPSTRSIGLNVQMQF
jgi:TonB-linked SusC/RagA family outer membrane protein